MCDRHQAQDEGGACCPRGGRVHGFMQPKLLLLLAQKPAHGYELIESMTQEEDTNVDPGLLYRTLRQFEEDGLVRSSWDTEGRGPARRVYEITDEGLEYLRAWAENIQRTRERLERFLGEYEAHFASASK